MKRWLMALACLLLCAGVTARAETQAEHPKMTVANGEVYCITGDDDVGTATIHRVTKDGVLYCLQRSSLFAVTLETGERQKLLALPEDIREDFVMNDAYIAIIGPTVSVYDRVTGERVHAIELPDYPWAWALHEGQLYLTDNEDFTAVIDLTTGQCWTGWF